MLKSTGIRSRVQLSVWRHENHVRQAIQRKYIEDKSVVFFLIAASQTIFYILCVLYASIPVKGLFGN